MNHSFSKSYQTISIECAAQSPSTAIALLFLVAFQSILDEPVCTERKLASACLFSSLELHKKYAEIYPLSFANSAQC